MRCRLTSNDPINPLCVVTPLVVQHARRRAHPGTCGFIRIGAHQPGSEDKWQSGPRMPLFAKIKLLWPHFVCGRIIDDLVTNQEHGVGARVTCTRGVIKVNHRGLRCKPLPQHQFSQRTRGVTIRIRRHGAHLCPGSPRVQPHRQRSTAAPQHSHRNDAHRNRASQHVNH